jgi:hypothetical protein
VVRRELLQQPEGKLNQSSIEPTNLRVKLSGPTCIPIRATLGAGSILPMTLAA